ALPHQLNDKPRDMAFRHEVLHIRRQQQCLIDIPGAKILAHSSSLNQTRSKLNSDYSDRLLEMSVDVITFGCRLNAFESEVVRREAEAVGLTETIVINSCAVTNEAVAQARQSIRRLKRERPELRIVVTGCAAQTQPEMFAGMAEVDRVVGNDDKMRIEAWRAARTALDVAAKFGIEQSEKIAVSDIMA